MNKQDQEFYARCAREEFNRITKKHTFRSFVNQDRSPSSGSDLYKKVRRMQDAQPANNASALKFFIQEYAPSIDAEK